jgi:hypothetical protein
MIFPQFNGISRLRVVLIGLRLAKRPERSMRRDDAAVAFGHLMAAKTIYIFFGDG